MLCGQLAYMPCIWREVEDVLMCMNVEGKSVSVRTENATEIPTSHSLTFKRILKWDNK